MNEQQIAEELQEIREAIIALHKTIMKLFAEEAEVEGDEVSRVSIDDVQPRNIGGSTRNYLG